MFVAAGAWSLYGYVDQYIRYRGFGPPVSTVAVAQQGRIVAFSFRSAALGGRRVTPLVYLPAGYPTHPHRRYPVLYLLHGTPGDPRAAFVDSLHIGLGSMRWSPTTGPGRCCVVMPPGSPGTYDPATEWANGPRRGEGWFTYLTRELPRAVDARYRTIRNRHGRAIAGYSSGADAAINAILWRPTRSAWPSPGAATSARRRAPWAASVARPPLLGAGCRRRAGRGRRPCPATRLPYAGRRDRVLRATMAVGRDLRRAGVRVRLDETAGGHAWELWAARMDGALRFASAHLEAPR